MFAYILKRKSDTNSVEIELKMLSKEEWLEQISKLAGVVPFEVREALKNDRLLCRIRQTTGFLSEKWFDPMTPAMIRLSCEAVGGRANQTYKICAALGLMNLSINLWDDILDRDTEKLFKKTLVGELGEQSALIIGGLALAKASSVLSNISIKKEVLKKIDKMIWGMWTKLAVAEITTNELLSSGGCPAIDKLKKIKDEAVFLETCMKVGSLLGHGSAANTRHLGSYGRNLSIVLELGNDFRVSMNLTVKLADKIRRGALPYSVIWASEQSEQVALDVRALRNKQMVDPLDIRALTSHTLETRVLEHVLSLIVKHTNQALASLKQLDDSEAKSFLEKFAGAQPQLFRESIGLVDAKSRLSTSVGQLIR